MIKGEIMMRQKMLWAAAILGLAACGRTPTGPMADGKLADQPSLSRDDNGVSTRNLTAGAVYTLSNNATTNTVIAYSRASDGQLTPAGTYPTGGRGTGGGLGSQGAVVISADGQRLFAVNAGSNDITEFLITNSGLVRTAIVPSGGTRPISLSVNKELLYVLNAGGTGNVTAFRVEGNGGLYPIANSTRPLSSNASGPAQVGITPNGQALVVTEKATNTITTYLIGRSGLASSPIVNVSSGQTPFGFTFDKKGLLIVSEAFGGAPGASAASTYVVYPDGKLRLKTASLLTGQTAACWFAVSDNGKFAYSTNTGSADLTAYGIRDEALSLVAGSGNAASTNATPLDVTFSVNSQYLYVLTGSGFINAFSADASTGALTGVGAGISGLPAGTVGLAAR